MTSASKNFYIDKLDDTVNECNNTYHRTIKMKPADVGDHLKISKYKNIFAKDNTSNWSEEIFVIKAIKNIVPWTYVINNLNGEKVIGTFYEKELQKANQEEFRIEKVIKRKETSYMSNGKDMIIHLIAGLIKNT